LTSYSYEPKNMKYGKIAGNKSINTFIYNCFEYICEEDQRRFLKKFCEQPHNSKQIMHTFRELVLGAYLSSKGFRLRHEYVIDTQTPDWCILDDSLAVKCIVELVNFHIDKATEHEIEEQSKTKDIVFFWRDQNKDNVDRLYHCIWDKIQVYKVLAKKLKVSYIVAVFIDFIVEIDFEEIQTCLFNKDSGLLKIYPEVSGVLYFRESSGRYLFQYLSNPNSSQIINLSSGVFPY